MLIIVVLFFSIFFLSCVVSLCVSCRCLCRVVKKTFTKKCFGVFTLNVVGFTLARTLAGGSPGCNLKIQQ